MQHRAVRVIDLLPLLTSRPSVRRLHGPPNFPISYMPSAVDAPAQDYTFQHQSRTVFRSGRRNCCKSAAFLHCSGRCWTDSQPDRCRRLLKDRGLTAVPKKKALREFEPRLNLKCIMEKPLSTQEKELIESMRETVERIDASKPSSRIGFARPRSL